MRTLNLGILAQANGVTRASAFLPVARVRSLQHQLPGLSAGEGTLETRFGGYQPVGDNPPMRSRSGASPLERDAWLASLALGQSARSRLSSAAAAGEILLPAG